MVKIGDKYGYADESGAIVIAPAFWQAEPFCEGMARVKTGPKSKWAYIDRSGTYPFKERFAAAEDFSGGLARVMTEI